MRGRAVSGAAAGLRPQPRGSARGGRVVTRDIHRHGRHSGRQPGRHRADIATPGDAGGGAGAIADHGPAAGHVPHGGECLE